MERPPNDTNRIEEQQPPGEFSRRGRASVPSNLTQKDEEELLHHRRERKKKLSEAREKSLDLEQSPSPSSLSIPSMRNHW
jgi:hypothetical protein